MPLVYINIMEGRPTEKIEKMISSVSEAIADSLDADINSVRIMVNEMAEHQYGVGGKPWSVVKAERAAAAEAAE
jgi:4-oxalocrotonate tautomerase